MSADIVICGAGIAGISAAYYLAVRHGIKNIVVVDERSPLSLTSDKSTECYRNWWPGPGNAMVALMNHSIDLMEELAEQTGNRFHLNRRGYLFCTASRTFVEKMQQNATHISDLGAGPLRIHLGRPGDPDYLPASPYGYENQPTGADFIFDPNLIHTYFPYLSHDVLAALHIRRAGWFSAHQMGMYLTNQAQVYGVTLLHQKITGVKTAKNAISSVILGNGDEISTPCLVNAAGPMLKELGQLSGIDLPVFCEPHEKIGFNDNLGVIDRNAPLLIWSDEQILDWTMEEQEVIRESNLDWFLNELPAGVHIRPEGGSGSRMALMLWEYQTRAMQPEWPMPSDPQYPEIVLRGLTRMLPGLKVYLGRMPRPRIDGGYYTKTIDNRPLIGEMPVKGTYVIGALSGFGMMSACGAGELLASIITGDQIPAYAPAFSLDRFSDSLYLKSLNTEGMRWQL